MKKSIKLILIILAALAGVIIIISIIISPIAKNYIEKHDKELIGRTIEIDRLAINIFSGSVRIDSLTIKDSDEMSHFLTLDRFKTRVSLPKLLAKKVIVKYLTFDNLDLYISQNGDRFSFDDIIDHFKTDTTLVEKPKKESSWIVGLYNIGFRDSHILYRDLQVGSQWNMNRITLDIPDIVLGGQDQTDVGLNLNFIDGGNLKAKLNMDSADNSFNIDLSLSDFSLEGVLPYLQQSMNAGALKGVLYADLSIDGDTEHIMNMNVTGNVALADIALADDNMLPIASLDTAYISIDSINLQNGKYLFKSVSLSGIKSAYEIYADTTNNFSRLTASVAPQETVDYEDENIYAMPDSVTATTSKPKPVLSIASLRINGGQFTYTDNSLPEKFVLPINNLSLSADNFNPTAKNNVTINASVQESGTMNIKWIGSLNDIGNQDVTIGLHNINLSEFTPYTLQYFAYPITSGNLVFTSQNVIVNNELNGTNKLDIFKCEVGKKVKKLKPEFKIPMRTGIYILKDKDEHININLPVSGDISSPEFSYKKLIMKTLGNLLVKVVTAPATYLAEALGFTNDGLQEIEIEPLQADFTTEQYDKFNTLADMVKQKPEIRLSLTQNIDFENAVNIQSLRNLKREFYLSRNAAKNTDRLDVIDMEAIDNISSKSSALSSFADSLLTASGKPNGGEIGQKARNLYSEQSATQVEEWLGSRNERLKELMLTRKQLPESSITIAMPPVDSLRLYKGKNCYVISMAVGDESTVEIDEVTEMDIEEQTSEEKQ